MSILVQCRHLLFQTMHCIENNVLEHQCRMSVRHMKRCGPVDSIFEANPAGGLNYRITNTHAALGCQQLTRLPETMDRRCDVAVRYQTLLVAIPGRGLPRGPDWAAAIGSAIVRACSPPSTRRVTQSMLDAGIANCSGITCSRGRGAYPADFWTQAALSNSQRFYASGSCAALPHNEQAQDRWHRSSSSPADDRGDQRQVVDVLGVATEGPTVRSRPLALRPSARGPKQKGVQTSGLARVAAVSLSPESRVRPRRYPSKASRSQTYLGLRPLRKRFSVPDRTQPQG